MHPFIRYCLRPGGAAQPSRDEEDGDGEDVHVLDGRIPSHRGEDSEDDGADKSHREDESEPTTEGVVTSAHP